MPTAAEITLLVETAERALTQRDPDARDRVTDRLARAARDVAQAQRIARQQSRDATDMLDRALADLHALAPLADLQDAMKRRRLSETQNDGPTAETVVKNRRIGHDPIRALYDSRRIDQAHVLAAREIETVYTAVTSSLAVQTGAYEGSRVQSSPGTAGIPERVAALHTDRYLPWARWMAAAGSVHVECKRCGWTGTHEPEQCPACSYSGLGSASPRLALLLDVCAFGRPLREMVATHRMRHAGIVRLIRLGLQRYVEMAR
jgi:hypothetical protein